MATRYVTPAIVALAVCLLCGAALCYPLVTMPTATMVTADTLYLDYYFVDMKPTNPYAPRNMQVALGAVGMTDRFEMDIYYLKPEDMSGKPRVDLEYLGIVENRWRPAVAIGAEDVTEIQGDRSVYIALAKTVTPMTGRGPSYPLVNLNLGYGTTPRAAVFGGALIMITPGLGIAALSDGNKSVYAATYMVPKMPIELRAGTLGRGSWVGVHFVLPAKWGSGPVQPLPARSTTY